MKMHSFDDSWGAATTTSMSLKYESMSLECDPSSESLIGGVSPQPKTPADELISFGPIAYQRALWERLVQPVKTIVGLNLNQMGSGFGYLCAPLSREFGTYKTVSARFWPCLGNGF